MKNMYYFMGFLLIEIHSRKLFCLPPLLPFMDGYTFVQKVLDHDGYDLDKLLVTLDRQENSAIEFKATFLPPGDATDEPDAYSWNVISDVIAIANSSGGCVLLGVNDSGEYAEAYLGDLSLDKYKLRLNDHIFNKAQWSCNNKVYSIKPIHRNALVNCINIFDAKLAGHDVLVILIRPTSLQCPIVYDERKQSGKEGDNKEFFTYRSGTEGVAQKMQVPATVEEVIKYQGHSIDSPFYDGLWKKHIGEKHEADSSPIGFFYTLVLTINAALILSNFRFLPRHWDTELRPLVLLASVPFALLFHSFFLCRPKLRHLIPANIHAFLTVMTVTYSIYLILLIINKEWYSMPFPGIVFCVIMVLWACLPILLPKKQREASDAEHFINPDKIHIQPPIFTLEQEVADEKIWWHVEEMHHGWQLQKHRVTGHYRILDSNHVRRAWGWKKYLIPIFENVKEQLDKEHRIILERH